MSRLTPSWTHAPRRSTAVFSLLRALCDGHIGSSSVHGEPSGLSIPNAQRAVEALALASSAGLIMREHDLWSSASLTKVAASPHDPVARADDPSAARLSEQRCPAEQEGDVRKAPIDDAPLPHTLPSYSTCTNVEEHAFILSAHAHSLIHHLLGYDLDDLHARATE